ncbi:MAG: PQ-loop domain-containing transporter [Maricaulaceae bacterium]
MIEMEIIAYLAAFFKSSACLPQTIRVLKTRQTKGLSLTTYAMLTLGIAMWLGYGVMNQLWPLVIASSVSILLNFCIFQAVLTQRLFRFRAFRRLKGRNDRLAH